MEFLMSRVFAASLILFLAVAFSPLTAGASRHGISGSETKSRQSYSWSYDSKKIDLKKIKIEIFRKFSEYKTYEESSNETVRNFARRQLQLPKDDSHGSASPVPEPGAAMLFATGIAIVGVATRRRS
jgi:hypothetical protein